MIRALLVLGLLAPHLAAAGPAAPTHLDWRRAAAQAHERADYPAYLAAIEAALALRPDSPRYLFNLAGAYALSHRPADALAALRRLAAWGVVLPLATAPDLASLRDTPAFQDIVRTVAAHRQPHGRAVLAFELPAMTGIVEGLAYRPATQEYFFGDVHHRCVWRRGTDGAVTRFSAADAGLLGVFNLTVDEAHRLLWFGTSAVPEISGYDATLKGQGALCALDLGTGRLVRRYPLPADNRDHCLGDLLLAPDGTIYVTDSAAPVIWRLVPGADRLEPFVESPGFMSLQGLGLVAGGSKLLVTDYGNGLLTIDLASRAIRALAPPPNATLLGLDGLVACGTDIIAVQNGVEPQRVVRVRLAPGADVVVGVDVLAAALPGFDDLTLIALVAGRPHVVSQSGWAGFANPRATPPPHPVQILTVGAD
jgi:sugar lactone lactonase YvrE